MTNKARTGRGGYNISNESEMIQDAFRNYSQYLVGLALLVEPEDEKPSAECYFYSGFVMQFGREWYWVTAGHIMEQIEPHLSGGVAKRFRLIDNYGFGADRSNAVPFDYEGSWRYHIYDKRSGLDFGAVEIAPFYRRTLQSNAVAVVKMADWRRLNPWKFPRFVLTGLADDSTTKSKTFKKDHYVVHGKPTPNLILADQIPMPKGSRLKYKRIAGQISEKWPEGSIVGMSGGPIFGIRLDTPRSPIIAVQSSWLEGDRIALGCPITVFGPMLEKQIQKRRKAVVKRRAR